VKYAHALMQWLSKLGYTHCYFVAGGNIMHLLEAARTTMKCVPVVHEVAAGIATEYHNEARGAGVGKAFALVTAGPGLTNIVTALAGAYLESRELLVLGGQVKTSDLRGDTLRQRGIQEVDGVAVAKPVAKRSERLDAVWDEERFLAAVADGFQGRAGPVFLEMPLDVQATPVDDDAAKATRSAADFPSIAPDLVAAAKAAAPAIAEALRDAKRPVILLGGGVSRETARALDDRLRALSIPIMTTWNGADRFAATEPNYAGRPNTWGQRSANVLQQQADVLVALGTRLGLQQTGFNWEEYTPLGRVIHVDIDAAELAKGHPKTAMAVHADANALLADLASRDLGNHAEWLAFCREVREALPVSEASNRENASDARYLNPYDFVLALSGKCKDTDVIVPCSSGGAFTVMMQAFQNRRGQTVVTDKGLASMGYGLSGAIGAALGNPGKRVVLVEGDGGFSQNSQELATVAINRLPLKIFLFSNEGYASIRMTQRNYFKGAYVGCDTSSGLGFPRWDTLFEAYGIPCVTLDGAGLDARSEELFASDGPAGFVVPIDPEQSYYPKITSYVLPGGGMRSNPLHKMSPDLAPEIEAHALRYMKERS
jgi:acetolactate synthase-1/2/3 large subunit